VTPAQCNSFTSRDFVDSKRVIPLPPPHVLSDTNCLNCGALEQFNFSECFAHEVFDHSNICHRNAIRRRSESIPNEEGKVWARNSRLGGRYAKGATVKGKDLLLKT